MAKLLGVYAALDQKAMGKHKSATASNQIHKILFFQENILCNNDRMIVSLSPLFVASGHVILAMRIEIRKQCPLQPPS